MGYASARRVRKFSPGSQAVASGRRRWAPPVVQKLSEVVRGEVTAEWEQWVDTHSPNARNALRSLFPALLYKSLPYALTRQEWL